MTRATVLLLAVCAVLAVPAPALAHSGRYCGNGTHSTGWFTREVFSGDASLNGTKLYHRFWLGFWLGSVSRDCS